MISVKFIPEIAAALTPQERKLIEDFRQLSAERIDGLALLGGTIDPPFDRVQQLRLGRVAVEEGRSIVLASPQNEPGLDMERTLRAKVIPECCEQSALGARQLAQNREVSARRQGWPVGALKLARHRWRLRKFLKVPR